MGEGSVATRATFFRIVHHLSLVTVAFLAGPVLANPSNFAAPMTYPNGVGGTIAAIAEDGVLVMEDGGRIQLWGVAIVDGLASEQLLVGRSVGCDFVFASERAMFADCALYPLAASGPGGALDLFIWIPDLGLGRYACDSQTQRTLSMDGTGIFRRDPYSYWCRDDNTSVRRPLFSE